MFYRNLKEEQKGILPLTELQKEIFTDVNINKCDYLEINKVYFNEEINQDDIREVLNGIVKEQPALRVVFRMAGTKEPVQVLLDSIQLPIYLSYNNAPMPVMEEEPWNMVIDTSDRSIELRYCHIVMDGWSMSLFWKELLRGYSSLYRGEMYFLNKGMDLREYFEESEERQIRKNEKEWISKYVWNNTSVIADFLHTLSKGSTQEKATCTLENELSEKISGVSSELKVSPAIVFYMAWSVMLGGITKQDKVSFGLIMSGRGIDGSMHNSIGMYIQKIPMCVRLCEKWEDICVQIKEYLYSEVISSRYAEKYVKEEIINQNISVKYDTLVAIENYPMDEKMLSAEDSIINQYEFYERPSNDFTLQIRTGKTTEVTISSSKEQHYDFLGILLKTYVYILEQMAIQGKAPEEIQFCKDETDIICEKVIQPYKTLTNAILSAVKKYRDRVAIVDTNNKISYNELFKKILDGRYHLLDNGIKKGDAVGINLGRSVDELVAIYSVILAGGIYVPFANVPLKRANYMIEQADVKLLITDGYPKGYACKCMDYRELFQNRAEKAEIRFDCLPTDTAYILFTSGSTGVPKGCVISHGAITNRLCWNARALKLGADTKQLFKTPTTFDVSLVEIFSIFFAGHTLYVLPEGQEKNPEKILNAISQYQINYLHFVPSMLRSFYEYIQEEEQIHQFDSVKTLVCSGEILPADLINKINVSYTGIQIVNLYGPTEAAVDVSCYFAKDVSIVQTPIGKAIDNTVLLIVDHKQRKMPVGIGGEIYILGSNIGDGYIGQEDLSRKFFVQMKNGETAYRTGDYAYYLTDENIVVLGRKDEQVKYNGVRIEIPEIENAMMSTGLISCAAVVLQKKEPARLIAFYTADELCSEELKTKLMNYLPSVMMPGEFVYVDKILLSVHGKADKKSLLEKYEQEKKVGGDFADSINYTVIEKELNVIWNKILNTNCNYHIDDNFFSRGGNSLDLIRIFIEIKRKWNVSISTENIYANPTISYMEKEIEHLMCSIDLDSGVKKTRTGFEAKKKIVMFQLNNPDSTAYNMPILMKVNKNESIEKIEETLINVLNYYRWNFKYYSYDGTYLTEHISQDSIGEIERIRCSEEELVNFCNELIVPFAIEERLFRVKSIVCGEDNYIFMDFHHLLLDQNVVVFLLEAWIKALNNIPLVESETVEEEDYSETVENFVFEEAKEYGKVLDKVSILQKDSLGILKRLEFEDNLEIEKRIKVFCHKNGRSKFQVLLATFSVLCWKISGKRQFSIGTNTSSDEIRSQNMNLITMGLDIQMEESLDIKQLLNDLSKELLRNMKESNTSVIDNYDVMFVREENVFECLKNSNYVVEVSKLNKAPKCALALFYSENETSTRFCFDYDLGYFEEEMIKGLAESYLAILRIMIDGQAHKVSDCAVIGETAKKKMDMYAQGKQFKCPEMTLQEYIIKNCQENSDTEFIYEGNSVITKKDFFAQAEIIAANIEQNVERDSLIGIMMPIGIHYLETVAGILMAGCAFLPLDMNNPLRRNEQILRESYAVMCMVEHKIEKISEELLVLDINELEKTLEFYVRYSANAYCIFTSGSSGMPKGCIISQKSAENYLLWANGMYCEGERQTFALFSSPAVDMTITSTLIPLMFGHKVIIFPQEAESVISAVKDERVTIIKATPSHLELLEGSMNQNRLHCLIVGGEQFYTSLAHKVSKILGERVKIYNEYGPTEATVACAIYQYVGNESAAAVPIGIPIRNMKLEIRDQKGNACIPGLQGEIVIEGIGVVSGYINNDEMTSEKFYELEDGNWGYKTGDMARLLSDGIILYEGRTDEQYKISGYRVELAEISLAAQEIEGISWAYSLMDNKQVKLYCNFQDGFSISEVEFRKLLFERIPRYMMPSQIIMVSKIPVKANGKIDLESLKKENGHKVLTENSGEVHDFIRQCWKEELGTDDFSDYDGFLEIGGNSISIVSLCKKINAKYPEVTVGDLFCYPSVSTLTDYLLSKSVDVIMYNKKLEHKDKSAITGIGFRLPQAEDLESLRRVFRESHSQMRILNGQRAEDEKRRLEHLGLKQGDYRFGMVASLKYVDQFDYEYFHIGKDEAIAMDPAHKLILSVIDDALENAGITKEEIKGKNCAVIIAAPTDIGFLDYVKKYYPSLASLAALNEVNSSIAGRVSFIYDLHGPAYLVDSACSSGLVAMNMADSLISSRECEMAIVAGANLVDTVDYYNMEHAKVLSANYHANSFSAEADGTARGEGVICFIVEGREIAKKRNGNIYAYIEGCASNNDGFAASLTAPNGRAQEMVIRQAWASAGLSFEDADLLETHGTATPLGDEIELQALNKVFYGTQAGHCAISAAKSVFGHLDSVSGLLGILKCIVSMTYDEIYPIVGMVKPVDTVLMIGTPFYFPDKLISWKNFERKTTYCGISSFGLSGTNVHLVLGKAEDGGRNVKYASRLKPVRCWLPDEAERIITEELSIQKEEKKTNYSEEEILRLLLDKVNSLFADTVAVVDIPLYQSGFDSISVIQLKMYIRNKFGVDIEVSSKHTIQFLAKQIVKDCGKKEDVVFSDKMPVSASSGSKKTNWYEFQVRNSMLKFQDEYIDRTKNSFDMLNNDNIFWANGRFMTGYTRGLEKFSYPIIVERGEGAIVWDIDQNEYIDFSMGFGANLFGYKNTYIVEQVEKCISNGFVLGPLMSDPFTFAERISKVTGLERVSFCNSGTESIMNLIRIARAATGKEKIAVFDGSFHGTFDPVYVQKYENENQIIPMPRSVGIPYHYIKDVIMLKYGEVESLEYLKEHGNNLAAVLVEPVQSRHPDLRPKEFISKLRDITEQRGIILLFDEVINGFRNGLGGAQAYFGVQADLVSYGKVIGGGYPIGVFGGKAKYMDMIDHRGGLTDVGNVSQWVSTGGTFNGHPISVAAGAAALDLLEREGEEIYTRINHMTDYIADQLNEFFRDNLFDFVMEHYGSQFIITGGTQIELRLLQYLLISHGIYVWEGGTCFVSAAHSWEQIEKFVETTKVCALEMRNLMPADDEINAFVDPIIDPKSYPQIKKLITKYPDICEVSLLGDSLYNVLSYNIANHSKRLDYAMIHLEIEEIVDESKLKNSLNKIVNMHRHLRSSVSWRHLRKPIRLVFDKVECPLEVHHCSVGNKEQSITEIVEQRQSKGFEIEKAPLVFFDVVLSDKTDIIMSYYNSWFDGWSADELLKEIADALFKDIYPEQIMDWNEYADWKEQNRDKVENYWQGKITEFGKMDIQPLMDGNYFEIRKELPKELNIELKKYCQERQMSTAAMYLSAMGKVLKSQYVMTSISGRGAAIAGIMSEIGLFSGIVPVKLDTPAEINLELEKMNKLPVISYDKIAELNGIPVEEMLNFMMCYTVVILNRNSDGNLAEIRDDDTFTKVPLRVYISPEREILITANDSAMSVEDAERQAEEFIMTLHKMVSL